MASTASQSAHRQIRLAQYARRAGDTHLARRWALPVLQHLQQQGVSDRDLPLQAGTQLLFAQLDMTDSRMASARTQAGQALRAFRQLGEPDAAADALCVLSYCASALGQAEPARQAAQDCVDLYGITRWVHTRALGLNYLGVAGFWQGDHLGASHTLDAARDAVLTHKPRLAQAFQPHVNAAFNHFLALHHQRRQGSAHRDASPFLRSLATARRLALGGDTAGLTRGGQDIGLTLLTFLCAQAGLVTGHEQDALLYAEACRRRTERLARTSWLRALPHWWNHDHALERGDHRSAAISAWSLRQAARLGEHQPLTDIGEAMLAARAHR
jgi:hypothetical protein